MKAKLDKALKQLPYLPRALRLVWAAAGVWAMAWLALILLQGLLPVATVYLTRAVVDGLVAILGKEYSWTALSPFLLLVGLTVLTLLAGEALRGITGWMRTVQSEQVQDHIHGRIHEKALALDIAFYDSPDYYDRLHRARIDAVSRPAAMLENIGAFLQNGVTLAAMCLVLLRFGPWLPLILFVSTLPALFVVFRNTLRFHAWRVRNTAAERRCRYYDWMITERNAAPELRLFGLGIPFRDAFRRLREGLRRERGDLAKKEAVGRIGASVFGLAALAGGLAWMSWKASRGTVTLGELTLFYLAFSQGQRMMRDLLSNAGEIYRNMMFLENLFEYLELMPQIQDPERPSTLPEGSGCEVSIVNVSFRYPGSPHPALADFSLLIPKGRIAALVGENGAGKSTLIKLLCRFYDPDAGRILLDGLDLRDLNLPELRRRITVLFQEPVRYHETIGDNIAFGDLAAAPGMGEIEGAARAAGAEAFVHRLPLGYRTLLGKWFGGAELSVGEWQRLALARAFLRRASLIILDEPTSAMDSWAETDWLSRFRRLAAGRTALIITHRFTTALRADRIYVMHSGCIIEEGTHDELLSMNGRYAASWRRQTDRDAALAESTEPS
ncbi:ABC transporter ATP-binding protein [Desulfatiglans anilini]|uniref:ABC transporter ATP-binding protein n=1 Tax=Desulfatiglans anilini TaxID=90728 RepID=UPI0003FB4113|nr:ABC transporter ATP-binding protein [Desulfatiglans anilini]